MRFLTRTVREPYVARSALSGCVARLTHSLFDVGHVEPTERKSEKLLGVRRLDVVELVIDWSKQRPPSRDHSTDQQLMFSVSGRNDWSKGTPTLSSVCSVGSVPDHGSWL